MSKSKRKNRRKSHVSARRQRPYAPVKMKYFEVPNPFGEMPREERLGVLRTIGAEAEKRFVELFPRVQEWFEDYDAPYLLSFCAVYFLSSPEGIDREATEGKLDFYHHYLELLQAFALTRERSYSAKPLMDKAEELEKFMRELNESIGLRGFAVPEGITDEEMTKRRVLAEIRTQTTAVRNWAYPDQIARTVNAVLRRISPQFSKTVGIESERIIRALQQAADASEEKLNEHLRKMRAVWRAKTHNDAWASYCEAFPDIKRDRGDAERIFEVCGHNLKQLKVSLVYHSDLRLADIFTFSLDQFAGWYGTGADPARLRGILDGWSFSFGDLKGQNTEHFILANPILRKPFIRLEQDRYFCPVFGIIYHMLPALMEGLLQGTGDKKLLQSYERARSKFLEDETERLLRAGAPDGEVFRGSKWHDPITGVDYENDVLVILPPFAIVAECKSGLVDPPARRGAELRFVDTLADLVVAPSEQANRFIRFLVGNPAIHDFPTDGGRVNRVDNRDVRFYLPLSVTFENLGTISANLKQLAEARFIERLPDPLVPSICVTDLEIIVELLDCEIELVHYLARRGQIERELDYFADEMDLLAFYLDTGFNFSADTEDGKPLAIQMVLKSKELDPFFTARMAGKAVKKPELALTKWWEDILATLVRRKPRGWVEIGYSLLFAAREDQEKLERLLKELAARVRRGETEQKHNWIVLKTGSGNRSYAIAGYPYTKIDRDERNEMLRHIIGEASAKYELLGMVCLGAKADGPAYPYDVLAYISGEELKKARDKQERVTAQTTTSWIRAVINWLKSFIVR